jgi:hypothetical protein
LATLFGISPRARVVAAFGELCTRSEMFSAPTRKRIERNRHKDGHADI